MAVRRWGPTLGAGVVVIEQQAEKLIEPSPLGITAYIGVTERGEVGKLNSTLSKNQYLKKLGSYVSGFYTPDCSLDFWDHSAGAGELHVIRVTDGTEVVAEKTFFNRNATTPGSALKIKAKNGGKWGGQKDALGGEATMASDLTETTLDTGLTMLLNEWAGGYLALDDVAGKLYKVKSNTTAGVVTVESDYTMLTDYGAGTDDGWALFRYNDNEETGENTSVAVEFGDGDVNATDYFSMSVYVNDQFVKRYPNLSMDSTSAYYVVNIVNDDTANDEVEVEIIWGGSISDATKPANHFGVNTAVTATLLTCEVHHITVNSPTSANPTLTLGTLTTDMVWDDTITCTVGTSPAFTVSSARFGAQTTPGAIGSAFTPDSPYIPPFTLTDGSTVLATGDTVVIHYTPFVPDALIGGTLIPDYAGDKRATWRITDNAVDTITVSGEDMTPAVTTGDEFMVITRTELEGGYDGGTPTDADFTNLMATDTSPWLKLVGQNKGLVKLAAPGHCSSTVDKQGISFAEFINWQWSVEMPSNILTEVAADEYINDTIGRNDFAVTSWPSWGYIDNPQASGQNKLIPLVGARHGREASVARNYEGYHKAASGIDVTLPKVKKLDVGEDVPINEEYTNRLGINIVKKVKGNYILWGDRTISLDPAWKWKHQRETMSHYERQLIESFDWIIFQINDVTQEKLAKSALLSFFKPEWKKGAIRGTKFEGNGAEYACTIKIDGENNTDATRAAGDLYCDITLRLADTIERFIIRVGKAGVTESVS